MFAPWYAQWLRKAGATNDVSPIMVKINRRGSPIVFTNTHARVRDLRAALVFSQVGRRESRQPRRPLIASCASGACRFERRKRLVFRFTHTAVCFAGRTTRLTPSAVSAMPASVTTVIDSPNKAQAIKAVVGGTR